MGKAAIGVVGPVENWGTEAQTLHLAYPQKGLNQTAIAEAVGIGHDVQNCLIAITCNPSTLEDSYCLCSSAVDRGLFLRYAQRYYKASSTPVDISQVRSLFFPFFVVFNVSRILFIVFRTASDPLT
jgi:hypothetical protein